MPIVPSFGINLAKNQLFAAKKSQRFQAHPKGCCFLEGLPNLGRLFFCLALRNY